MAEFSGEDTGLDGRGGEGTLRARRCGPSESEGNSSIFDLAGRLSAAMRPLGDFRLGVGTQFVSADFGEAAIGRILRSYGQFGKALGDLGRLRLSPALHDACAGMARQARNAKKLEDAGWVAHVSTPWGRVDTCDGDAEALHDLLSQHYREKWPEVRRDIEARLADYEIDAEAVATVAEALQAHDAGFYRCVCRVLIPEIERVVRRELHDDRMDRIASQERLRKLVGKLPSSSVGLPGLYKLNPYRRLSSHLYANVTTDEDRRRLTRDPVPNRHAAVHGLVVYSTMQSSLNAIFLADYIFLVITALKRRASAEPSA